MSSPFLALFARSVREDTRNQATYWTRIAIGGFILLFMLGTATTRGWVGATGRNFFMGVITLQAISISLIGLSYFSSAVTEEKEDATLGLLRMTNLSPLGILLGKSTSRLCSALLLLAAQFPFTVVAVTLGGISLGQIGAAYCSLAAYIFLLCNVALLGSVLSQNTPRAALFTGLVVAQSLVLGPLLRQAGSTLARHGIPNGLDGMGAQLWSYTLIARLREVFATTYASQGLSPQVISNIALGAFCFLLSWLLFDRFCDRHSIETAVGGSTSSSWRRGHARPPRPEAHALAWKDFHFMHGGRAGQYARFSLYGVSLLVTIVLYLSTDRLTFNSWPAVLIALTSFAFSIDLGATAARTFGHEIRDQTFSSLAILPGTIRQLARQKVRACLIVASPGLVYSLIGSVISILQTHELSSSGDMRWMAIASIASNYVRLLLLAYVVAWFSLSMKRGALPVGYVVTYALQMLISMLGFGLLAAVTYLGGRNSFQSSFGSFIMSIALTSGLFCLAGAVITYVLHHFILHKLQVLAAEN